MFPVGPCLSLDDLMSSSARIHQIMVKNPKLLNVNTLRQIKSHLEQTNKILVLHAPYSVNLAHSSRSPIGSNSISIMLAQIELAQNLATRHSVSVVFHVGKTVSMQPDEAIANFTTNLETILEKSLKYSSKVRILLETPAGQGTEMFVKLSELLGVFEQFKHYSHFGLCLDTCHTWSAGLDFETLFSPVYNQRLIESVKLVHLNDSQTAFHSKVDRHANLGHGSIFRDQNLLSRVVQWCYHAKIPIILETDSTHHAHEIKMIYKIIGQSPPLTTPVSSPPALLAPSLSTPAPQTKKICDSTDFKPKLLANFQMLTANETNEFKKRAYRNVISLLYELTEPVTTAQQLKGVKGIGKGTYDRIVEIIEKGWLTELKEQFDQHQAVAELSTVSGIGPVKAKQLFEQHHITSIKELNQAVENGTVNLNRSQMIGLKHDRDIKLRIPREEILQFDNYFREILQQIDPSASHLIVGSYRRGCLDSGDIDILFLPGEQSCPSNPPKDNATLLEERTPEKHKTGAAPLLDQIVTRMQKDGWLDAVLSQGPKKVLLVAHYNRGSGPSPSTPSSASSPPNLHPTQPTQPIPICRRVDFLLTSPKQYAAAAMYFTGSKEFNIIARQRALSLGYKLNEYGLFQADGQQIDTPTEEAIFDKLQMPYLSPRSRGSGPSPFNPLSSDLKSSQEI